MIDDRLLLDHCIIHDYFSLPRPARWSDEKIYYVESWNIHKAWYARRNLVSKAHLH